MSCKFPQQNLDKMCCIERKIAKATWKKAEVLFFQLCGKWMVIVVIVVSFRPELQFPSWVLVPGSSEVRLERMNQRDESNQRMNPMML